jgi:hypothetical protein
MGVRLAADRRGACVGLVSAREGNPASEELFLLVLLKTACH